MSDELILRLKTRLYAPNFMGETMVFRGLEHVGGAQTEHSVHEPHKKAAVLVPIIKRDTGYNVILTKRSGNLRKHSGQNSFPGGLMDLDDENLVFTALREANEEIGIFPNEIEVLAIGDTYFTRTEYAIRPIIGLVSPNARLIANPDEVDEVFEVPIETVFNPNGFELRDYHIRGQTFQIYTINYAKYQIWGITCAIIRMLCNRIFDEFEL